MVNPRTTIHAGFRGVAVYKESYRLFSVGDRVQFTAPSKKLHIVNRGLGILMWRTV